MHRFFRRVAPALASIVATLLPGIACAALSVDVVDKSGAPFDDAVVWAVPASGRYPAHGALNAMIDQVGRQFSPRVVVIQTGTSVSFPNKDNVRHQVYSFSQPKTFELALYSGVPSTPVVFDKPGLVIMGCNIHDRMVGFVRVVDTPWFAKTGKDGVARLEGLPNEDVVVHVWHWMAGDATETVRTIRATPDAKLQIALDFNRE